MSPFTKGLIVYLLSRILTAVEFPNLDSSRWLVSLLVSLGLGIAVFFMEGSDQLLNSLSKETPK